MRSFALDIETMDTEPTAALTAIGMVEFHHDEGEDGPRIDREFYCPIHLATSVAAGGTMDASTVLWWMQEDLMLARRKWLFNPVPIDQALNALIDWIKVGSNGNDILIYARGPQFDCTIVRQSMKRLGLDCPWGFRQERDTRTMCAMYPSIPLPEPLPNSVKHFALDDAVFEARTVWNLWRVLNAA